MHSMTPSRWTRRAAAPSVQETESRILKTFSLCPSAVEPAEHIARNWLGGEAEPLVRAALDHLVARRVLHTSLQEDRIFYQLNNNDLRRDFEVPLPAWARA